MNDKWMKEIEHISLKKPYSFIANVRFLHFLLSLLFFCLKIQVTKYTGISCYSCTHLCIFLILYVSQANWVITNTTGPSIFVHFYHEGLWSVLLSLVPWNSAYFVVRYGCKFVIALIVITEFDCMHFV
jgi:hypothetical protein